MSKAIIDVDMIIEGQDWPGKEILQPLVESVCEVGFSHLKLKGVRAELSLVFTDDATMQEINHQWRGKNKPTNVLSFPAFTIKPGDRPQSMLGDIILAYETLQREAQREEKEFNHHLTHLLVHGLLHLLGYDHETQAEAGIMEGHEVAILADLAIPNPYEGQNE